ncbi:Peptidyl-prolyl cis-trans isomerase FKBP62 [Platanthera zijinensis]|uniref:peptidylprolyl isomerase n=1 Tax=Platanthera zijinensis TaxID=2320716 RepID=A0AAP0B0G6_9ASPA
MVASFTSSFSPHSGQEEGPKNGDGGAECIDWHYECVEDDDEETELYYWHSSSYLQDSSMIHHVGGKCGPFSLLTLVEECCRIQNTPNVYANSHCFGSFLLTNFSLKPLDKDICKDGGIFKKIFEGEKWENPMDHDEVLVKYEASLEDGALVSKVDEAKAIKTMKKGEKVLLTVKPQYAFGEKGRPASGGEGVVPPNATLLIELELLSWKTVTEIGDDKKVLKKILKEKEVGSWRSFVGEKLEAYEKLEAGTPEVGADERLCQLDLGEAFLECQ